MEAQRKLGEQIDELICLAEDGPAPRCGLCSLWRNWPRRKRNVEIHAVTAGAMSTGTRAATGTAAQARLFGIKRADPHTKLAEAAISMESRIAQLDAKAESERAEAKRLVLAGQKPSAMRMLKRAKATEKQLEANQASLLAVEQQVDLMAQAKMQKEVASALSASSKGMKAQKKLLKHAESAVDDAQDARDMADDLGNVMAEFAQNGNADADDEDLMAELQQMVDDDPSPPGGASMVDVSLNEGAKTAEIAKLEARLARYDQSAESRKAVEQMPTAPTATPTILANGKAKLQTAAQLEKQALLTGVSNCHV